MWHGLQYLSHPPLLSKVHNQEAGLELALQHAYQLHTQQLNLLHHNVGPCTMVFHTEGLALQYF